MGSAVYNAGMSDENPDAPDSGSDPEKTLAALEQLRAEHRQMDMGIKALIETGVTDMLKIARMKKLKLHLKDRIQALEDSITPDIIA